jgi:hypothetical protein
MFNSTMSPMFAAKIAMTIVPWAVVPLAARMHKYSIETENYSLFSFTSSLLQLFFRRGEEEIGTLGTILDGNNNLILPLGIQIGMMNVAVIKDMFQYCHGSSVWDNTVLALGAIGMVYTSQAFAEQHLHSFNSGVTVVGVGMLTALSYLQMKQAEMSEDNSMLLNVGSAVGAAMATSTILAILGIVTFPDHAAIMMPIVMASWDAVSDGLLSHSHMQSSICTSWSNIIPINIPIIMTVSGTVTMAVIEYLSLGGVPHVLKSAYAVNTGLIGLTIMTSSYALLELAAHKVLAMINGYEGYQIVRADGSLYVEGEESHIGYNETLPDGLDVSGE